MHSSKRINRTLYLSTGLCCLSLLAASAASDVVTLGVPDGKKQTSAFDVHERDHFGATIHLLEAAYEATYRVPMAAVGLEDCDSSTTILFYFSQPGGPETAWYAGVEYREQGAVVKRVELQEPISFGSWIRWYIAWDESGVVNYELVSRSSGTDYTPSGTISTRIRRPKGIRVVSGTQAEFEINFN